MGFVIGPGIQSALTEIGTKEEGYSSKGEFVFDMYTAPGWVVGNNILCDFSFARMQVGECGDRRVLPFVLPSIRIPRKLHLRPGA